MSRCSTAGQGTRIEVNRMYKVVAPYPIAPGKTEEDVRKITAYFRAYMDQYKESRRRLGVTVERVYFQPTPMGSFVVAYEEGEHSFADQTQALVTSDLEIDRKFVEMIAEVHGVDLRQPPAGPPPETVGMWVDPQVTTRRKGLAFVAPLLPGKLDAGRAFAKEAYVQRHAEFTESRRALNVNVEVVSLTSTPMGDLLCGYIEGTDPVEGNRGFAASTRPFDVWFKNSLKGLFPPEVDFSKPLPPITELWDYTAELVTA